MSGPICPAFIESTLSICDNSLPVSAARTNRAPLSITYSSIRTTTQKKQGQGCRCREGSRTEAHWQTRIKGNPCSCISSQTSTVILAKMINKESKATSSRPWSWIRASKEPSRSIMTKAILSVPTWINVSRPMLTSGWKTTKFSTVNWTQPSLRTQAAIRRKWLTLGRRTACWAPKTMLCRRTGNKPTISCTSSTCSTATKLRIWTPRPKSSESIRPFPTSTQSEKFPVVSETLPPSTTRKRLARIKTDTRRMKVYLSSSINIIDRGFSASQRTIQVNTVTGLIVILL